MTQSMGQLVSIIAFGTLGIASRYGISSYVQKTLPSFNYPLATFCINIFGSLAMGFIASYPTLPNWIQRGLMIGFLGGFTTFSAYALDSIKLLESFSTNTFESILYIFGSPVFCIGAAFCGRIMYRFLQGGALGA